MKGKGKGNHLDTHTSAPKICRTREISSHHVEHAVHCSGVCFSVRRSTLSPKLCSPCPSSQWLHHGHDLHATAGWECLDAGWGYSPCWSHCVVTGQERLAALLCHHQSGSACRDAPPLAWLAHRVGSAGPSLGVCDPCDCTWPPFFRSLHFPGL